MFFFRLWILRRLAFITLFSMSDIIFRNGGIPCTGFHLRSKENASEDGEAHFFLNEFFHSAERKSDGGLEDVIYSDVLNNLRSLIKTNNYLSADSDKKECRCREIKGKNEKSNSWSKTESKTNERNSYKTNVLASDVNEVINKEGSRHALMNLTLRYSEVKEREYALGFSGSPFGSRQPVGGIVEVPKNEFPGREAIDPRKKRSVLHLYNMVLCTTGCNPFVYKGYGCYCGFLGSGFVVDGIDSCCKMHDWCYNSAGCPMFLEYFIPYLWKCYRHQPLCAIDHGHYGGPGSCAQRLCECDRQLALCLRRYPCPSTKALCTSSPWRLLQNILML